MGNVEFEQGIDKEFRKKAITDFIIKNQGCNKQQVVDYCTEKGYASRETVYNMLFELKSEGIVMDSRKKINSKSMILTVDSNNLLIILPQELEILFNKFNEFMSATSNRMKELIHGKYQIKDPKQGVGRLVNALYSAIDMIHDLYSIYFFLELPRKVARQDQIQSLFAIYFGYVGKMYSLTITETKDVSRESELTEPNDSPSHISDMISRKGSATDKLVETIRICRDYLVLSEFYAVLQFMWEKHPRIADDFYSELIHSVPGGKSPDEKVEKAYSDIKDPTVKRLFKAIDEHIYLSDLIWLNGNQRYDNYDY